MSAELDKSLITVAKGASTIFIGLIIGNVLGMINQVILARFLGPADYGILSIAISVTVIVGTFASFGLVGALPAYIPSKYEKNQNDIVRSIIIFSIKFVFLSSTIVGVILYIFSEYISNQIFHDNGLITVLKTFAICLPLLVLPNVLQSILRAFGGAEYKVYLFDVTIPLTKILIFAIFIIIGNKLFGATVAYIGGFTIAIFASIVIIQNKYFPFISLTSKNVSIGKKLLSFSWPLALTGISFLFISKTDIILLGYYLSSMDVGIYTAILGIAGMLTFIGISFGWVFLPITSKLCAAGKESELESLFKTSSKWMFIVVLPIVLFILLFSQEIIMFMFGIEYVKGALALTIIIVGISMNTLTGLTGIMLVGKGYTKLNFLAEIVGGITNVALNILLIPIYGITGAAIGTSVSYFTRNCSSLAFVYKTSNIHPFEKNHIKILISGTLLLITMFSIKNYTYHLLTWKIGFVVISVLLFSLYTILIIFTGCLSKNDKFILKVLANKLGIELKWLERFI